MSMQWGAATSCVFAGVGGKCGQGSRTAGWAQPGPDQLPWLQFTCCPGIVSLLAGRAWTGRQALKLGLIDGLGEMRGVMQREYGDKARFLLCR